MNLPNINPGESLEAFLARMLAADDVRKQWPDDDDRVVACMAHLRKSVGEVKDKYRRLKKVSPQFISLVPKGANRLPVLYKSDDETAEFSMALKEMNEQGEVLAVVYAPEFRDSQGDIADAEVVKEMAYEFQRIGGQIDIRHNGKAVEKADAYVAQSFIVQKGDARFDGMKDYEGNPVGDVTGAWAVVLKIESEDLRKLYRDGEWNGVSLAGPAEVEYTEKAENRSQRLLRRLKDHLGMSHASAYQSITLSGEIDMTGDELIKALAESNKALVTDISKSNTELFVKAGLLKEDGTKAEAKVEKQETETDEKRPVFKGDISDSKALRKFEYDSKRYDIEKEVDVSDHASLAKAAEAIAELNKEFEDVIKTDKVEKAAPSNAPTNEDSNVAGTIGLSKEEADCVALGRSMATQINKERGYHTA